MADFSQTEHSHRLDFSGLCPVATFCRRGKDDRDGYRLA